MTGAPVCQVCGTGIETAPRLCERCETPHHADCWEYAGRCSTYACGATEASLVGVVQGTIPFGPSARDWCWAIWEGGAGPEGRPCAAGEHVVAVPRGSRDDLAAPDAPPPRGRQLGLALAGALAAGMATSGLGPAAVLVAGLAGLCVRGLLAMPVPCIAPDFDRLEFVRNEKGRWLRGVDAAGRTWLRQLPEGYWPRQVRLERAFGSVAGDGEVALTYELSLFGRRQAYEWRVVLAPPVEVVRAPERREQALVQLVALRALGQHIARLMDVPFEEGVAI